MENLGRLNGDGFTLAVDSAICSSTCSDLETCSLHSFASIVDSAIKSDTPETMSNTQGEFEDFQLFNQPQLGNNSLDQSSFPNFDSKTFQDFSKSNHTQTNVTVNGQPISDRVIKKVKKFVGSIHPGNYCSTVRLVRCPKCQNILRELADYSVYQCGGCGAVLRAKHEGYVSGSLSDEGKVGGDSGKSENSLEKGLFDRSDALDVEAKSSSGTSRDDNQRDVDKIENTYERFQNQSEDDGVAKSIGKQEEEPKSQIAPKNRFKLSGRISNWKNGERSEMDGFWRKPLADMESLRFSTSKYPDEGPSNGFSSFSSNYMQSWRNHNEGDGAKMVQHLEQDLAELPKKLNELKVHLSRPSETVPNKQKEKVLSDERMVSPYHHHPYGGSDPWFSDCSSRLNRTSRQYFGSDKYVAGSTHFYYHHDLYPFTSGYDMAMRNFPPSMHNPNRYGDPFASQMPRRGPHQFQLQPLHPYYPGRMEKEKSGFDMGFPRAAT